MKHQTVGHLRRGDNGTDEILLGKRKSTFFDGVWGGGGGNCEKGETPYQCLARELNEEYGIRINGRSTRHVATAIYRVWNGKRKVPMRTVYFFDVMSWRGTPQPSEGFWRLQWFRTQRLPYHRMFTDMSVWLPVALKNSAEGKKGKLRIEVCYDDESLKTIREATFKYVK